MGALFVTAVSISCIFIIDKLADLQCTNDEVDKMLRESVKSLAILIGFGWEKTFDMGVIQITTFMTFRPVCLSQLAMGLSLCALVIPAWRMYILPTIVAYDEEKEREKEGREFGLEGGLEEPLLKEEEPKKKE